MREEIAEVPHVKDVIWYDSFADISIPMELLPDELYEFFNNQETGSTLLAVLTILRCQRMRRWMRSKKSVPL